MNEATHELSERSRVIPEDIAEGRAYEQILARYPDLTYLDIFAAAREALALGGEERKDYAARLARIRQRHPRAYERWGDDEDARLKVAVASGRAIAEIAVDLQRQPSAIRSRLSKLGVGDDLA
jgi:DNA-binding NarL/FixJ family response regulator